MLFNGERSGKWENDIERRSRFVFIGVKLNKAELCQGFQNCLISKNKNKEKMT